LITLTNKTLTAPVINSPTGIVKADVGLGNVDNTSDANKPISSAAQSALDLKAPIANPTFTGVPAAPTAAPGTDTTQIATTAFVIAQAFSSTLPSQTGNNGKYLTTDGTSASWGTIATSGDVSGPASAVDSRVAAFDGITGKLIKDSGKALPSGTIVGTSDTQTLTNKTWNGVTIGVGYGGTGLASYTIGDIPYASDTTTLSKLAGVAVGNVLLSGGVGAAPSWGKVSLTSHISGTLALGNGGTGQTTAQAAMNALAASVADGYYLRGNGTNAVMTQIQAADVPTLNQNTTGSAATLTTSRAIYGNNFNGSAALTQVIASTYGGTGNGFTKFTGPVTSEKTFTLPNASATLTYDGGPLGTPSSGNLSNCTKDGTNGVGYLNIPQNSQAASYTLVIGDAGKHIYRPTSDTTARTWTIPSNASVAFPIGTAITFVNDGGSATNCTIAITSDTLVLSPDGSTGSRTLARYGVATAIKVTATRWMISGTNLT
jgi:hypothetical protein